MKESPYTKVCSLRRQSSSPASSFSFNSSDGLTGLHSALRNSRDGQSLCSPSWDRAKMEPELDDVFVPYGKMSPNRLESPAAVADHLKPKESIESPRDPAQTNGSERSVKEEVQQSTLAASSVEHLSSALSSLMNSKNPEGQLSVSPSCPLEDSSLHDFEVVGSCEEATEAAAAALIQPTTHLNYVRSGVRPSLPSPDVLGCGNPFLIFLCLTVLLQHRDSIINRSLDSNEMAMHFDRLVRKHNLERVLSQARTLYYRYLGHFNPQNS